MSTPAVELYDLRKTFRARRSRGRGLRARAADLLAPRSVAVRAVDGVTLRVERGERVAFIGPNGAGKSTTLKILAGILYPDSGTVRVDGLVPPEEWGKRYDEINAFEDEVVGAGTTIVKVALMISHHEQYKRLHERLERPDKYWKFNPNDVDSRAKWPAYQEAYQAVFERTSTDVAPWHVIPADEKWYARLAVSQLLWQALAGLDLDWPPAEFDVAEQLARLEATGK